METQFDDEPIDYIDSNKVYNCSPHTRTNGFTLLMKWCLMYHKDPTIINKIAEYIKIHPESLNEKNGKNWTPLIISARNSQTFSSDEIVSLLVNAGADIDAQCILGGTALISACLDLNNDSALSTIHILLDGGANPNIMSSVGTPFEILSDYNINILSNVYQKLINNGFDVNIKNFNHDTPLIYYLKNHGSDLNIISCLLDAGADIKYESPMGRTALNCASTDELKEFISNYESFSWIKEPDCQ